MDWRRYRKKKRLFNSLDHHHLSDNIPLYHKQNQ